MEVPAAKMILVILDNDATHIHPSPQKWLARNLRCAFHFVSTLCSWLNAIVGFFAKPTK